jgi:hypothetical protein
MSTMSSAVTSISVKDRAIASAAVRARSAMSSSSLSALAVMPG